MGMEAIYSLVLAEQHGEDTATLFTYTLSRPENSAIGAVAIDSLSRYLAVRWVAAGGAPLTPIRAFGRVCCDGIKSAPTSLQSLAALLKVEPLFRG